MYFATGTVSRIPGVPPGTRAAALPDAGIKLADDFLTNLGRPARESACECERSNDLQLGPVMALISGPTADNAIAEENNELARLAASDTSDADLVDEIFVQILSRPATQQEIESSRAVLRGYPEEHRQLAQQLEECERELAPAIAEMERARQVAVDKTKAELAAYEHQIAEREAQLDRQHAERLAQAEAALKRYEGGLPQRMAAWEQQAMRPPDWTPLDPVALSATNGATLARQQDLSVLASGSNGKGTYQLVARSEKAPLTGIKLEVLADERLPSKGPGRSPNGNFVLTEFRVEWSPEGQPDQRLPVSLQNAQADFSQKDYDVATAIDGKKAERANGWATHPQTGQNRTAVFETKEDLAGPGTLTLLFDQEYADGQHTLGRFRVSVTTSPRPIALDGLPQNIGDILAVAAKDRTDAQKAALLKFYRGQDGELKKLEQTVAEAKKPRPVDPRLQQLRDRFAEASRPVPLPPRLVQLRRDVELSTRQLAGVRLTFAQDLAWALINSPAFLFNR